MADEVTPMTIEEFRKIKKKGGFIYELIDGVALTPMNPGKSHQILGLKLGELIEEQLLKTPYRPLFEVDIKDKDNIYHPDLAIFHDDDKMVPKIIFEILSPASLYRDLVSKVDKYAKMGVLEYWIIDLSLKSMIVHDFVHQASECYTLGDAARSTVLREIRLELVRVFDY